MVTMSTVGYGDKAPIIHAGRRVAIFWMLVSIFAISVLTAHITSNLTLIQMRSSINGPQDLIQKDYPIKPLILPYSFREQDYGIALQEGSPLREPINRGLLGIINSPAWQDTLSLYLGSESR